MQWNGGNQVRFFSGNILFEFSLSKRRGSTYIDLYQNCALFYHKNHIRFRIRKYLKNILFLSFQRQDTDERLRRLQSEKESLALQVQVLTEQVSAQNEKIVDLEKVISDKSSLLNNTEDLLQRVSAFAHSVGIQIDKQKVLFISIFLNIRPSIYHTICFLSNASKFDMNCI